MTTTPRDNARLAPATVTDFSQGKVPAVRGGRRRVRTTEPPVTERTVDPRALRAALAQADGDHNRLWFADDGAVWVLNHHREERCPSRACPACSPRRPSA